VKCSSAAVQPKTWRRR